MKMMLGLNTLFPYMALGDHLSMYPYSVSKAPLIVNSNGNSPKVE